MRQKIYIETSVVSYYTARLSKDIVVAGHQSATLDFWKILPDYEVYISELVIQEAERGDRIASESRLNALSEFNELEITNECKELAKGLTSANAIPSEFPEDALHIAVASFHGVDVIVTWNFKHINNASTRHKIRMTIEKMGYSCPEICSPDEFLGGDDE